MSFDTPMRIIELGSFEPNIACVPTRDPDDLRRFTTLLEPEDEAAPHGDRAHHLCRVQNTMGEPSP